MIGTIDIKLNAAKPNFPLSPFYAFINSPSHVRIVNVPRKIGDWEITAVYITANFPDNQSASATCSLDGGCWHGTIGASTATGSSTNGFTITASGVKEDGTTAVTGYVLGKGDVYILDTDGTITVGDTTYYIHLVDTQPSTPHKGDLCIIDGVYKIYNGSAWTALGSVQSIAWSSVTSKPAWVTPANDGETGQVLTKTNSGSQWETVSSGTTDYDDLENKPKIAGTTLSGDKSLADLGIMASSVTHLSGDIATSDSRVSGWETAAANSHTHSNKAILDTIPTSGTTGYVLKKSASGTEWAAESGGTITSFSDIGSQSATISGGTANLSNYFTTGNTVLASTVKSTVASLVESASDPEVYNLTYQGGTQLYTGLDPETSTIEDVVKALKGIS